MRLPSRLAVLGPLVATAALRPRAAQPPSTLIRNATLLGGTGARPRVASVRVAGDRVVAAGALSPVPNERVVDATGLALAPGFVDTHSHYDRGGRGRGVRHLQDSL